MSKHTPGPWRTFNATDVYPDDDDTSGSKHIADCDMSGSIGGSEQRANARLIAAAPDLLAALKEAVEFANKVSSYISRMDFPASDKWLAAIAKAEGRDNG